MWPLTSSASYRTVVDAKRAERAQALSSAVTYDAKAHGVYLKATASEIVARIDAGEWTASEVLEAYISRAAYAHGVTNCVTEVLFEQARGQARELDDEFAKTRRLRGPLHGVPVSIKDQFEIAGVDASIGFTRWCNKPSTKDADIVQQLRAAGAIPIVKTNVPQTLFAFECSNPLWGTTTNPYNDKYTCGGSSGGEGAILAMDGSALGIGSDIGGSLRIPASYCGIYSLKPGHGRISRQGAKGPTPGFLSINTVTGPMGRSVEDLELLCRTAFGGHGDNQEFAPLPYREVKLPTKLRFGYYTSDGYVKASPACKRAVLETVEALRREGHECIEFEVPSASRAFNLFIAMTSADGFKTLLSHIGPDPTDKSLFLVTLGPSLNGVLRAFAAWIVESLLGDKLFADSVREARVKPVHELMRYNALRDEYVNQFNEQVWQKHGFDGIIAPVQALPQLLHGGCATLSSLASATILYNVVDSPVGVIPVTHVDPSVDQVTDEWTHGPGLGSSTVEGMIYRGKKPFYDPVQMGGMPVGIQVVGKRWEEEKVLGMMHVVDRALGGTKRGFGPGSWNGGGEAGAKVSEN